MRWARFDQNGSPCYAVIEGDTVIPVHGSPFSAWERTSHRLKLTDVRLLVPVMPQTFYAAGMNYPEPVREGAENVGQTPTLPNSVDTGCRAKIAFTVSVHLI